MLKRSFNGFHHTLLSTLRYSTQQLRPDSPTVEFLVKSLGFSEDEAVSVAPKRLSGSSLLIFANKQDIQGALSPAEITKVLNLEAMDKTSHWKIVGCNPYTSDGLLDSFDWLVQDIASRIYMLD